MRETSLRPTAIPRSATAALATVVVLLVAGTLVMWMHYGTAVFYEMIVAGISMCL
jgi:hypothetical protein